MYAKNINLPSKFFFRANNGIQEGGRGPQKNEAYNSPFFDKFS